MCTLIDSLFPINRPRWHRPELIDQPFEIVLSFGPLVVHPVSSGVLMPVNDFRLRHEVPSAVHLAFVQVSVPRLLVGNNPSAPQPCLHPYFLWLLRKCSVSFFAHAFEMLVEVLRGHEPTRSLKAPNIVTIIFWRSIL